MQAAEKGNEQIAQELVEHGAKVNLADNVRLRPRANVHTYVHLSLLMFARCVP